MTTLSFSLALALAAHTPTDPPPCDRPPARAIPADSFVGIEFAGLRACRAAAAEVGLLELVERVVEGGRGRLVAQLRAELGQAYRATSRIGLPREHIRYLLGRRCAIGLGRPTLFDDMVLPSVCVAFDIDGSEREVEDALQRGAASFQDHQQLRSGSWQADGFEWFRLEHAKRDGEIVAAFADDVLLIGNCAGYLRDCVAAWNGSESNLTQVDAREKGHERIGDGALLSATLHIGAIANLLPYAVDDVCHALGVSPRDRLFVGAACEDGVSRDLGLWRTHDRVRGVAAALLPDRVALDAARYFPPDALFFASGRFDVPALAEAGAELYRALPKVARRELERELRRKFQRELKHVIGPHGEELMAFAREFAGARGQWSIGIPTPSPATLVPHGLLALELDGVQSATDRFVRLVERQGLEPKTVSFRDRELHYVRANAGIRFAPAMCQDGDTVLMSSDLRTLKASLARCDTDRETLASREGFAPRLRGDRAPALVATLRIRELFDKYWPTVEGLARGVERAPHGIDLDEIPERDEIMECVSDVTIAVRRLKRGVELRSDSLLGFGSLLAVAGGLLDETLAGDAPKVH